MIFEIIFILFITMAIFGTAFTIVSVASRLNKRKELLSATERAMLQKDTEKIKVYMVLHEKYFNDREKQRINGWLVENDPEVKEMLGTNIPKALPQPLQTEQKPKVYVIHETPKKVPSPRKTGTSTKSLKNPMMKCSKK